MAAQVIDPQLHPLNAVARCLEGAAESLAGLPQGPLPAGDVGVVAADLELATQLERRLGELRLRLSRTAEASRASESTAASDTGAWVGRLTGSSAAVMRGGIWLARKLEERYPSVRDAFARGLIGEAHARVIVRAAEQMPAQVTDAERDEAVSALVDAAVERRMNTKTLRRRARRMLERIEQKYADQHEADLLGEEEARAQRATSFTMGDNGDGTWSGTFTLPDLQARWLLAMLEHLTSPRRVSRNQAGDRVVDPTVDDRTESWAGLSYPEKLGHAFTELCEHLPTDGLANHGRVGATVAVHIDHQHLIDGLAAAHLDTGGDISAGQARRLACNAGIMPIVYGKDSAVLDAGREARLHNKAQRIVLSANHDTCAAEGCERPFAWCEVHHPIPWSTGGHTDLTGIPLCGWHHHRAHDALYDHRTLPTGEVRFHRRR